MILVMSIIIIFTVVNVNFFSDFNLGDDDFGDDLDFGGGDDTKKKKQDDGLGDGFGDDGFGDDNGFDNNDDPFGDDNNDDDIFGYEAGNNSPNKKP